MAFDLINGEFFREGEKVFATDFPERLLFSDYMRANRNRLMCSDEHYQLMVLLFQMHHLEVPEYMKSRGRELYRQVERALVRNKLYKSAKVSLHFFMQDQHVCYLVRLQAMNEADYELNAEGLLVEPFKKIVKAESPLSSLRLGSEPYWKIMESFRTSPSRVPLLINGKGCLLEAPARNLYLIGDQTVHTAAPCSGVYLDPLKETIRRISERAGFGFEENEFLDEEDLLSAGEAFLAGDLYGIQWIKGFGKKRYLNKAVRELSDRLSRETD
jgi:branched-chain amino acid aminotransferase